MARLLIIEDDTLFNATLARSLQMLGHRVTQAHSLEDGLLAAGQGCDVIFLDVNLPDGNGLEAISSMMRGALPAEVIVITGEGDAHGAEHAMRFGAWDYLEKPFSLDKMILTLKRALAYREQKAKPQLPLLYREGIVGGSPELGMCLEMLGRAAGTDAPVLLFGETGTGKELFARALHANSRRAGKPFVVLDCAAIPDTLIESELFGHDKGAYTGAIRDKQGLVSQADGGTLFLDEIAEMPLHQQKALLRLLQEKRYRPVGALQERSSDFRVVSATNRDLRQRIRAGVFREDLLFRLEAFRIELPPLRIRRGDMRELVMARVDTLCRKYDILPKGFSPCFFEALCAYDWPGNVRELFYALERALFTAGGGSILYAKDLPGKVRAAMACSNLSPTLRSNDDTFADNVPMPSLKKFRFAAEKGYLEELLRQTKGNVSQASRMAGISRQHMHLLMRRYKLAHG